MASNTGATTGGAGSATDLAGPVRQILKPWHRIRIPTLSPDEDGLAEVSRIMLMLVIRNQMFLKASEIAEVDEDNEHLKAFRKSHEALVGNLSLLRTEMIGTMEVPEVLEAAREANTDLTELRMAFIESIHRETRERILEEEWKVPVSTEDVRSEIEKTARLIADAADSALESDWFDSMLTEE